MRAWLVKTLVERRQILLLAIVLIVGAVIVMACFSNSQGLVVVNDSGADKRRDCAPGDESEHERGFPQVVRL